MRIDHLAIWVEDLEKMRGYYTKYFGMNSSKKYLNPKKQFSSYFLSFKEGARLELMHRPDTDQKSEHQDLTNGITHFAISVGSREKVNAITETLWKDGHQVYSEPRTTGDGYYESVVLDPEGNQIEITE